VRKRLGLRKEPVLFSAETGEGVADLWRQILDAAATPRPEPDEPSSER
jgi:hypothetical protein